MITIKKRITIKYKLAQSVFESLNKLAYNTQARSLGTTTTVTNRLLANPTLLDTILPIIIGNNNKNSEWEHEKVDYVSSIQIPINSGGLELDLNCIFDKSSAMFKENIAKYIKDHSIDKEATEDAITKHIFDNKNVDPIDYHQYFRYTNVKDYLYWLVALNSSQVANKAEDADKSPNIRFFLYDEKVAKARLMSNSETQSKAVNKLISIRALDEGATILKNIAILKNVIPFDELNEMEDGDIYLELFSYANRVPSEFLAIAENKDLATEAKIRKFIESNVFIINQEGYVCNASDTNAIIGKTMTEAVSYFKNITNKGDITNFENAYKSLNKK